MSRPTTRIRASLAAFVASRKGNAAVEFGTCTPFLLVALVMMVDVGLALGARMEMDRNVRAGVQAAMSNITDVDAIRGIIETTKGLDEVSVTVNQTCSCGGAAAACTSWCSADEPPSVFINISAVQPYSGLMLPSFTLNSETHVQLR